jgi:hypothetical protein
MGVSYWAYAWVSPEGLKHMPLECRLELMNDWKLIRKDETGRYWKLECSSTSFHAMGFKDNWAETNDMLGHYQCISIDDSGCGGVNTYPSWKHSLVLKWKTWEEAEATMESEEE